jgi:hypothetical protein
MLEKDIEFKVSQYALENGVLSYKFTSPARAAVPDRLFIVPVKGLNGMLIPAKVYFCEFKREGKLPTPAQDREHNRLRNAGIKVYVIDNVEDGKAMVDFENS